MKTANTVAIFEFLKPTVTCLNELQKGIIFSKVVQGSQKFARTLKRFFLNLF